MARSAPTLDRFAAIGEVGIRVRLLLQRLRWPLVVLIAVQYGYLALRADPGATAFLLIGIGTLIVLGVWGQRGQGLPIIPLIAIENLIAYGVPIPTHNETIVGYTGAEMTQAGWEVLVLSLAMIGAWRIGMEVIRTASPLCYALQGFDANPQKQVRLGMVMVLLGSGFELLRSLRLLDPFLQMLPAGAESIIHVLVAALSACGFFLTAMMIGKGVVPRLQAVAFWVALALQCFISASSFLLSSTVTVVFSVGIGMFWGSGRISWRFVIIVMALLSFFNIGKFTMRDRYWLKGEGNPIPDFSFSQMPRYYDEWVAASWSAMTGADDPNDLRQQRADRNEEVEAQEKNQSLLSRVNNLQNLLFVINAVQYGHVETVGGATYSLIPPLLVPRILWPNKPRSHEGQVLLNVHFGRQEKEATFQTYIAWGLLPEAYGNFGPIAGAIVLGVALGFTFAWVEKYVARKLVLSLEGFLSFALFLGMANSYEMVASVLVTSLFQSCVPIIIASTPFVERLLPKSPPRETSETPAPAME